MNHHYPDNYHGYGHNAPGIPNMGYTGGYTDQAAMARMVHPREGYQMSHYQMMQQPGGIYSQGFIGQQSGNPYNMAGYSSYGMPGINQSVVMGNRQGDMNRMSGGNMVNLYYNPNMPSEAHSSPHHGGMSSHSHSQANPHMQQSHINMMSSQGHHSMPGQTSMPPQPVHGQSAQLAHSTGHSMSQPGPLQSSGTYGGQNSPHMAPRTHHVPQHPMRHPTTQQNPQEVADNILQMASAYPSNQTVQVPLKGRPAPYHIPRSPHYSVLHSDHQTSPNPHLQPQPSPGASCQASPSPSSSSVKSPTPVLVPIPNPIPSPGISGLRSPCNQGMSPCGTQRSPAHMGSTYSGHSQGAPPTHCGTDGPPYHHGMSPSEAQHYSPCGIAPTHNFSPFSVSTSTHRNSSMYSPSCDPSSISNPERHQPIYSSPVSSSSCSSNLYSYAGTSKHMMGQSTNTHPAVSSLHMINNPLMSLQKLVMLPETQVIDPKSVVNDTCLSSQDESPKNVDGPAEWFVESSSHSVGCQGQSSSLRSHPQNKGHTYQSQITDVADARIAVLTSTMCTYNSGSPEQKHSPRYENKYSIASESSRKTHPNSDYTNGSSNHQSNNNNSTVTPVQHLVSDKYQEHIEAVTNTLESPEHKLEKPNTSLDTSNGSKSETVEACLEDTKVELPGSDTPVIPSPIPIAEVDSTDIKTLTGEKIEKTSEVGNQCTLHPLERKNGRVKEDTKCLIVQCRSPSVLSEMPVVINGLSSTTCGNDDGLEQDFGNGVHARIQNAFNSLVKAKFARVKRVSQFDHLTPCSIAVGADERAACDRFAFRHNGFCRALRTSRVICNGRNRNDSTGNADSDESLENLSENSFGLTESPQDGNRKRPSNVVKRTERKKPNLNSATSEVAESDPKTAEPVTSGDNGCVSHGREIVSDEDTCYYEGVDSSDIFINNCSSDESVSSNGEAKQNNNSATATDTKNENQDLHLIPCGSNDKQKEEDDEKGNKKDTDLLTLSFVIKEPVITPVSSPPSKRLRRSSGQKILEKLKVFSGSRKSFVNSVNDKAETIIDLTSESMEQISASPNSKYESAASNSTVRNFREQNRSANKFRPIILGHRSGGKYPVVVLEKSTSVTPPSGIKQEQIDHTDQVESSSQLSDSSSTIAVALKDLIPGSGDQMEPQLKVENIDFAVAFDSTANDSVIKTDPGGNVEMKDVRPIVSETAVRPKSKRRKKKPLRRKGKKNKGEAKAVEKVSRDTEVRDSFKSMKFSRTLDLMKSRRRREQTSVGPFIRVVRKQNLPDTVTVFTQPVHESSVGLSSGKHKHSKNRNALPLSTATTIHMVTHLPMDKVAMVSSSRTISHNPWVCAFCAHHSSYRFLGDLYGPYFKESEIPRVESIVADDTKKGESFKDQKCSDSVSTRRSKELFPIERKSNRRSKSPLQSKSEPSPSPPEEIWVHEACAMWSPGVYLIGNKLYGLDEAVKDAAETVCSACKSKGAMIGCLHKGCSMKYHFICAIDRDCYMEEEKLSLLCPKHKSKKLKSAADSSRS